MRRLTFRCMIVLATLGAFFALRASVIARQQEPAPLVTGRAITPFGTHTDVGSFPANALLTSDGRYLVVTNTGYRQNVTVLSAEDGRVVSQLGFNDKREDGSDKKEGLYYGLALGP